MTILAIAAVLLSGAEVLPAPAPEPCAPVVWQAPAQVVRVIDGDTVELSVAVTPRLTLTETMRVAWVDAPETRRSETVGELHAGLGWAVANNVRAWVALHAECRPLVAVLDGREYPFVVRYVSPDKYGGRFVGELLTAKGESLGDWLLETGMANPYDGERKTPWTPERLERVRRATSPTTSEP